MPFGKGDSLVLDVLVVLVAAAGRVVAQPPEPEASILARFFSTSSRDGVAMAIYCRFIVRGIYCFLWMVYFERIVSGPATASVCLESGGLDSDNLPGIMYTIPS